MSDTTPTSDEIDSALGNTMRVQSSTVGDVSTTRPGLRDLLAVRRELAADASRADGSRPFIASADMSGSF